MFSFSVEKIPIGEAGAMQTSKSASRHKNVETERRRRYATQHSLANRHRTQAVRRWLQRSHTTVCCYSKRVHRQEAKSDGPQS